MPGQMELFDPTEYFARRLATYEELTVGLTPLDQDGDWPSITTSACGRYGFWRERLPTVFGGRAGIGPLLVVPDTNLLITLKQQLNEVEDRGGGLILRAMWSD